MRQLQKGIYDEERAGTTYIYTHSGTSIRLQGVRQTFQAGWPRKIAHASPYRRAPLPVYRVLETLQLVELVEEAHVRAQW